MIRHLKKVMSGINSIDPVMAYRLIMPSNINTGPSPAFLPEWLIALTSLALLVATAMLLRFRTAVAMRPTQGDIFAPLIHSVRLSVRYFWPVLVNTGLLRLLVSAIHIICIIMPVAVAEYVVLPQVAWTAGTPWVGPLSRLGCCVGSAAVSAILVACCTLYDARLFATLERTE